VNTFSNSWHTASNAAASASLPWQTTSYAAQLVLATAGAVAPAVEQLELELAEGAVAEEPGAAELEAAAAGGARRLPPLLHRHLPAARQEQGAGAAG
jgi:hypothetical protein